MGAGSGVGVATVLDASKPQFILVRTVGATYLIFLDAQAISKR
jgi:threonine/homoserine/homoserine lactone efflux protein